MLHQSKNISRIFIGVTLLLAVSCSENTPHVPQAVEEIEDTPVREEGTTIDGKKEGEWKWYFEDGGIKEISHWENDLPHGEAITFYRNGNKRSEASWERGRLHGVYRTFDSVTTIVVEELNYSSDTLQGQVKTFYNHGALEMIGFFRKGKKHGEFTYFMPDEKPDTKEVWENDSLIHRWEN